MIGRVLIGAHNAKLARSEQIQLPVGTHAILITEQEPEVTYLKRIAVRAEGDDKEFVLGGDIEIRPGRFRRFELPSELKKSQAVLIVDGHYRQLGISDVIDLTE